MAKEYGGKRVEVECQEYKVRNGESQRDQTVNDQRGDEHTHRVASE